MQVSACISKGTNARLLLQNYLMVFMKLDMDKVFNVPYKCCCFFGKIRQVVDPGRAEICHGALSVYVTRIRTPNMATTQKLSSTSTCFLLNLYGKYSKYSKREKKVEKKRKKVLSLFLALLIIAFQLFNYFVWLRITDEGSVPEMRIWSILLMWSDLEWCIHLSRSLFSYFNYLVSVTAGGPWSPRGHM